MIRYPVSLTELESQVEVEKPGWLARAKDRTSQFRTAGKFEEESSIWSEVKVVYMRLQNAKCIFCEREMESLRFGKVEQDVEHFRPKGSVKAWKPPASLKGIPFTAVAKSSPGYHLLPYHLFNYAAACKPCNSILKKDHFPIAGTYQLNGDDPAALAAEQNYLIYPIGDLDDDPETLIEFHGTSPLPVAKTGHPRNRALVTIEFFKLDDPDDRKSLYRDRALVISSLYPLLEKTKVGTPAKRTAAANRVNSLVKPRLRHLNCARSFQRLFEADPKEAERVYEAAVDFLATVS